MDLKERASSSLMTMDRGNFSIWIHTAWNRKIIMANVLTMAQLDQHEQQQQQSTGTTRNGEHAFSSMWRRQPMSSLVGERSDTTGEASVAKLVARLSSISRDHPAEG
jgi:hypothetical protein